MSAILTFAGALLLGLFALGLALVFITAVAARLAAFFEANRNEDYRRQALIRRLIVEIGEVPKAEHGLRRPYSKDAA